MILPKEVKRHELIGLFLEVTGAKNKRLIGLKGNIIDETKNIIVIQSKEKTKKLIKNQITMKIYIEDIALIIEGKEVVGKPIERIKK